jgi:hypothetical protein
VALFDQLAFFAVTTDTLLGVATPCTETGALPAVADGDPPQAANDKSADRHSADAAQRNRAFMEIPSCCET